MLHKILILISAITALALPAFATKPTLAPVDPLAWAVANADWGSFEGPQIDALRKIVNGQVAAHQLTSSYTDPKQRVVIRVKCYDPTNCIMCSRTAREAAKKLRSQISASAGSAQGNQSMYNTMATYAKARADALNEQANWDHALNTNTITETTNVGGEEVTTKKTVTVENGADVQRQKTAQALKQMAQGLQAQGQQQGSMVYSYINAADGNLQKPKPAVEMYVGSDPLE